MPRLEIRTPFSKAPARQAYPDVWRKKVLPVGEVAYKGRILKFTPEYLSALAEAFTDGAYDQVPFQIADAQNTHTNHPEQFRGEVIGMDVETDGLYVTAHTTPRGSALLAENPRLGVSARIVEGYDRSDGKHYPVAVQHVLGTLDPRIPGLGAWEAVQLSNDEQSEYVIDMSTASFAGEEEGGAMPDLDADQQGRLARLLELDPEKLETLISGIENGVSAAPGDYPADDISDDELVALIEDMDDASFTSMMSEYDIEEPTVQTPDLVGAGLSNDGYGYSDLEMANYYAAENARQLSLIQNELDEQRFKNEKRAFMNAGVPGLIVEMARPLLQGAGHVIEMSNGQGVDAGRLMRDVLREYSKQVQLLDLSGEMGTSMDEPDTSQNAEQARRDFVADYRRFTGI